MKSTNRRKFKVGELLKFTDRASQWYADHADEIYAIAGVVRFDNPYFKDGHSQMVEYGVEKFSYPSQLDIYALIEGDNGYKGRDFAYRVYFFNQLGEGESYIEPKDLERL